MKDRYLFWQFSPYLFFVSLIGLSVDYLNLGHVEILVILLLSVAFVAYIMSKNLGRPIERMRQYAEKIAHGDFSERIIFKKSVPKEYIGLANAMNEISVQLAHRIQIILNQKEEQEAVFSSMAEGVVVLNNQYKIKYLNFMGAKFFGVTVENGKGLLVNNINLNFSIETLIQEVEKTGTAKSKEVIFEYEEDEYWQVYVGPLWDGLKNRRGFVLVLTNITLVKKLEKHRREFVSNVSHELKTPLTSIQGFVETLMNPSVTDPIEKQKFLNIISRHSKRLGAIIEDLLSLSRIERESERNQIILTNCHIRPVLLASIDLCMVNANQKNIELSLKCDESLRGLINPPLLEQAIVNLLGNAIKYSQEKGKVKIYAFSQAGQVFISVLDNGPGIPKEHHSRLFERFYRVDKARGRKLGGTGLGLSIVKHIMLSHHGDVTIKSQFGHGTEFILTLNHELEANL